MAQFVRCETCKGGGVSVTMGRVDGPCHACRGRGGHDRRPGEDLEGRWTRDPSVEGGWLYHPTCAEKDAARKAEAEARKVEKKRAKEEAKAKRKAATGAA